MLITKELCDRILWSVELQAVYLHYRTDTEFILYKSFAEWVYFYRDGKVKIEDLEGLTQHTYPDIWAFIREIAMN